MCLKFNNDLMINTNHTPSAMTEQVMCSSICHGHTSFMKSFRIILILVSSIALFNSCSKDSENTDDQKPNIDLNIEGAFPLNCDTLYFGETINFNLLFTDNMELGSFSIDIHNNFDHHSHSTEVTECNIAPIKTPINPFLIIQDYEIPAGLTQYEPNTQITIPSGDDNGEFDEGDYHFFVSLTDKSGWSAQKGLSIKILKR